MKLPVAIRAATIVVLTTFFWNATAQADEFLIAPKNASISIVTHSGMFGGLKIVGKFNKFDGAIRVASMDHERSDVKIRVDTSSIHSNNFLRDAFLRSSSVLEVNRYPHAEYSSTSIQMTGQNTAVVRGKLTLFDVTKPLSFRIRYDPAEREENDTAGSVLTGKAHFRLSDFRPSSLPGISSTKVSLLLRVTGIALPGQLAYAMSGHQTAHLK